MTMVSGSRTDKAYAEELLDALATATEARPGLRVSHPKGLLMTGTFTASPAARELSRAEHLQGGPVRTTVRFSNASTDPASDDGAVGQPRGMSVRFHLSDGSATDLICQSWPCFVVRTPEEFLAFMQAQIESPEKLGEFIAAHPSTAKALELIGAVGDPPRSWATMSFNSSVSYRLVNASGEGQLVRWRFAPEAGEQPLPESEREAAGPDYLRPELLGRLPVGFRILVQLAEDGDLVNDSTVPLPDGRRWVDLGRLEVTGQDLETEQGGDVLVMDAMRVTDGVEPSDDPILHIRTHAYAISAARRTGASGG